MSDIVGRANIVSLPHGRGDPGPVAMSILTYRVMPNFEPGKHAHHIWRPSVDQLDVGDVAEGWCGYVFRIRGVNDEIASYPQCPFCVVVERMVAKLRTDLLAPPHRNPYGWNPEALYE